MVQEIPEEVLQFQPEEKLNLDRNILFDCIRSAPRGSSPGPGGMTYEHMKVLLDASDVYDLLGNAVEDFARADIPEEIAQAFTSARMTALRKADGGARGIATGTSLRRLAARSLARQYGPEMEKACAPFQFALSTKAGVDSVAHMVRYLTDADAEATILSIDGIGAYDHISRAAMLKKLHSLPKARSILPFVRLFYSKTSKHQWRDDDGEYHFVEQAEGGEQGDPLMPILFSLGIHDVLQMIQEQLHDGEFVFAFLDDIYVVAKPHRIRKIYDLLAKHLDEHANIKLNAGKTRTWNRTGTLPEGMDTLGENAWSPKGLLILGTPIGSPSFVQTHANSRILDEQILWDAIQHVPDLQCAWQILLQSANPRCNHLLRTLMPTDSCGYARKHDEGMQQAMFKLLSLTAHQQKMQQVKDMMSLPMRLGGLGMRSATRVAPAAHWGSFADALHVINEKQKCIADAMQHALDLQDKSVESIRQVNDITDMLKREGFPKMPAWSDLRQGARPEPIGAQAEPGEWQHGWQYCAASTREHHFRTHAVLSSLEPVDRAILRSCSGAGSSCALACTPTSAELTIRPSVFRILVLFRLRLALSLTDKRCEGCGAVLDERGLHRTSCMPSGRIRKRATPVERTSTRICREAGAVVKTNVLLRDMNVIVASKNERRLEILADGLPIKRGAQLAIDVTVRSSTSTDGRAKGNAANIDGAICEAARADKEEKYPELLGDGRCTLVVIALEVGGRWSKEAVQFMKELAWSKAREVPQVLRGSAAHCWRRRWMQMLSVAAATAWADSLQEQAAPLLDGPTPELSDILSR